jgi:glutamate dehydrogenase
MEKYDFTIKHLYGEDHRHIKTIIGILQAENLEEIFIRKFYSAIPMINLSDEEYKLCAELARNAFHFLQQHKNKPKLRLYQKPDTDHSIIEILTKDVPFLFDSAMCLLNRLSIEVERVAHPTIFVRRENDGKLLSIDETPDPEGSREIIIQIRTMHKLDETLSYKIEQELQHILSLVDKAVGDWQLMVRAIQSYIQNYDSMVSNKNLELYNEQREFLSLMESKYFVFLGSIEYIFENNNIRSISSSKLGILKLENENIDPLIQSTIFTDDFFNQKQELIFIGKINKTSVIHRETNIDYLCLKILDKDKNLNKAIVFIGLFTSILYYQSATLIPIIRGKLFEVLSKSGFAPDSYAAKELVSIVEALPRDELFKISSEELFPLLMEIYALLFNPELRIFLRKHGNTLSCLLFLPLEIANNDNIRKLKFALSFEYGPIVSYTFAQINDSNLCYYYFTIDTAISAKNVANLAEIEQELKDITKPWINSLYDLLIKAFGKTQGRSIFTNFSQAFPLSYRENNIYQGTIIADIENISKAIETNQIIFKVDSIIEGRSNLAQLKIYNLSELDLSVVMPMLQNIGFNVLSEQIYVIKPRVGVEVWLHQFILKADDGVTQLIELAKNNIEEAFFAIWQKKCQNDSYNQLVLSANLNYRQVNLLRALSEYLYQIKIGYSIEYIGAVLNKHSKIVESIISLFNAKFNHSLSVAERLLQIETQKQHLEQLLVVIHDNIEDQILRKFIDLVNNILRTNYFLTEADGHYKDFISFKINSSAIIDMPLPTPYKEIFVYSASFEAIHLRGGKVARGGIRWSDRLEDYRTEVLGLMKTQIVKNSVIVPTGAKGGFILKNTDGLNRDELQYKAVECYKNFLRGLLDITDNIVSGRVNYAKHIIHYDDHDPYLVVAADKGTATFSDTANEISQEYKFWLGDAFASGGSKGYDHKKMGITAKGGWIAVKRHFSEMEINIDIADFTVIGIGDMSGDVFGNGMLLSKHIKLVAAFNHMHIFVDPNPDSAESFIERERLFNLSRTTWLDYNPAILSKGGAVYDRKAKMLTLTPEIKKRFNLNMEQITPDELIKVLLKSEVDLLWNGGIGTYVKASFETHEQVGDKANDNLRCNAIDLRCKIIGEGGNLGLTQYARIEYARNGGRINTDAIDNSAGVDCSDHEVNIKIALNQAIEEKRISEDDRIKLLSQMTDEVADLVLKDNRTQTRALSIAEQQGYSILASQEHFIDILESQGLLDRKLECLPSQQQFLQLDSLKQGLTRPELSILLAYSKNAIYNSLITTSLAEDEYFFNELLLYFPEAMRTKYADIIAKHPLRREIITTSITNSMVNRIDTFYLHLTLESIGHQFSDIAKAYTVTRDLFGLRDLWKEINTLDGLVQIDQQVELYIKIKKFLMRSTSWLLRNYRGKIKILEAISSYQDKLNELQKIIKSYAIGKFCNNYNSNLEHFIAMKVPSALAERIAMLSLMSAAYNIIEVSNRHKVPVEKVTELYFELGQRFSLDWLRYVANSLSTDNPWQKLAINGFKDELYDLHRKITANVIEYTEKYDRNLEKWYKQNDKHIQLFDRFIAQVKSQTNIEYAMIDLSLKKLGVLLSK